MFMIDILGLPGVEEAKDKVMEDSWVDEMDVDDLIQAVAIAVERKLKTEQLPPPK